ncbi:hypothetical protein EDD18DRAFT_1374833 [Armillaria luteobubalina]|uniref:Transmembrane protein n=1 Tax=Armillaria luteobubalina TaxID=153913 RepID=A0AA39QQE7_9AGAR|nr:hypothetical protein EDD18DRAFT_1374833 [Armillaria luteobubalina]
MQTFNTSSLYTDFYINLNSWTLTIANGNVSHSGNLITAIDLIYNAFAFPRQDASMLRILCDTQIRTIFTINDLVVTLNESTLVVNQNNQCTGVIQQWSSPSATEYLLDSRFLSSVYVYALLLLLSSSANNHSSIVLISSATTGTVGFAQRNASNANSSFSTGAIVGIAAGSSAFTVLVFTAGILFYQAICKCRAHRESSESLSGGYKEPIYFGRATPAPPFTPNTTNTGGIMSITEVLQCRPPNKKRREIYLSVNP